MVRLCDLPGYGFAKVSKDERAAWQEMIDRYLTERKQLKVVVSIVDAEVGATPDDVQMIEFLEQAPPRILVVATKLDCLGKAQRKPALAALAAQLGLPPSAVLGFSATEKLGVNEVWQGVLEGVGG